MFQWSSPSYQLPLVKQTSHGWRLCTAPNVCEHNLFYKSSSFSPHGSILSSAFGHFTFIMIQISLCVYTFYKLFKQFSAWRQQQKWTTWMFKNGWFLHIGNTKISALLIFGGPRWSNMWVGIFPFSPIPEYRKEIHIKDNAAGRIWIWKGAPILCYRGSWPLQALHVLQILEMCTSVSSRVRQPLCAGCYMLL